MLNRFKSIPWRFLPVILLFCLLPLVVRLVHFNLDSSYQTLYLSTTLKDWFFYYKSIAFLFLTIWMLICLVFLRKKIALHRDSWFKSYYILGAVFMMMSLLSAQLSSYAVCSRVGAPTRFEGIGVIICYIFVMFYTFVVFEQKASFKYVIYSFAFLILFQTLIGFFQFIGYDPLNFKWIREWISPGELAESYYFSTGSEPFALYTGWGNWTGTLGNRNYSGSLISLALPFFTVVLCFIEDKKSKILGTLVLLASIFILFACKSQAGQVGVTSAFIALFVISLKSLPGIWHTIKKSSFKRRMQYSTYMVLLISYITGVILFTGAHTEIVNMFKSIGQSAGLLDRPESNTQPLAGDLYNFAYEPYTIHLFTSNNTLSVKLRDGVLSFTDKNNQPVPYEISTNNFYTLVSNDFFPYTFALSPHENGHYIFLGTDKDSGALHPAWAFAIDEKGNCSLLNARTLQPTTIGIPPALGFKGREHLGSNRGYIWSRSLPLLSKNMLLGVGPDAFIFEFPQDDLWGKWHSWQDPFIVVDKVHNTYLQIWINQGFIAFLAFVLMNGIYLIHCLKLYGFRRTYTLDEGLGIAFMAAIVGYLGTSFFNDTTLSVTPLYYAMLGCGMAYNRIYSRTSSLLTEDSPMQA